MANRDQFRPKPIPGKEEIKKLQQEELWTGKQTRTYVWYECVRALPRRSMRTVDRIYARIMRYLQKEWYAKDNGEKGSRKRYFYDPVDVRREVKYELDEAVKEV